MGYLLNLIYLLLLACLSPYLLWCSLRQGKYREGWAEKFLGRIPVRGDGDACIWLHAVSVGEVQLLAPLIAQLEQARPEWHCVISTTTRTGYALAQKRYGADRVFYCPLDFTWATATAMRRRRPALLVLAELELWPNLVRAARRRGARVAVINGRLSEKSFRGYRRIRWAIRAVLEAIDLVAAQNQTYADRFRQLGMPEDRLHVTGSIKFDGAGGDRNNIGTQRLRELAGITATDVVFLAGSTQAPEEQLAIETFRELSREDPRLRLILVPRHAERFDEVAALLAASGLAWQRRSTFQETPSEAARPRILLVDTIGELGAWWGTADIGFVGGSLGSRGGQNMIEPAAYGAAVSFGPNTRNFRDEVAALLSEDAAVVVHDGQALTQFVRRCLGDPDYAALSGRRAAALVRDHRGATGRTVDLLSALLPQSPKSISRPAA